ncbi:hypothetical protein IGI39_001442 [Enterococcus sp. AZ135]|uniref:hypothetical protein n=1 Tax=unclassified Enterococcus TaxID=2608891 RepID=UPI003F2715DC
MIYDVGDSITVKNIDGEIIKGRITKIYINTILVISKTVPHLVSKKEIYKQGNSIKSTTEPIINCTEFNISKF